MKQADEFTAANYDPEWVQLIKDSGARYTVITTKHHDGLASGTQGGRCERREIVAAIAAMFSARLPMRCASRLKLGFYYSLIDWPREDYTVYTAPDKKYEIKG